jgi:hypothetical protein
MSELDWNLVIQYISVATGYATSMINSSFVIATVGGFAGAFGGALGAQHIAERNRRGDLVIAELNATNSAIMLSMMVCNTALGLKKQIVRPLYQSFLKQKSEYIEKLGRFEIDPKSVSGFNFTADLTTFSPPIVPIEALTDLVLQKLNASGRPTGLIPLIQNAARGLANAIAVRDEFIANFKSGEIDDLNRHWYYFGERTPNGHQHREYSDIVEVIHSYTDDLIFFSASLCESLVTHGKALHTSLKRHPKNLPRVHEPDFSGPRRSGLFPPDADYSSFQAWIVE